MTEEDKNRMDVINSTINELKREKNEIMVKALNERETPTENYITPDDISYGYYFDGGSIGIKCHGMYNNEMVKIITIDRSLGTPIDEKGKWYVGWRSKGGTLIDNLEFKKEVIKRMEGHIKEGNRLLYTYIQPSLYDNHGMYIDREGIDE